MRGALLRLAEIEVDRYLVLDMGDLARAVDRLGGVEVEVPAAMSYRDEAGGVRIELAAGRQRLDGEQAVAFSRFRGDALGDIGRVQRQQALGHALLAAFRRAPWPTKIRVARGLLREAETNLVMEEALVMAFRTRGEAPLTEILPGWFHEYDPYWHPDMERLSRWVEDAIGGKVAKP